MFLMFGRLKGAGFANGDWRDGGRLAAAAAVSDRILDKTVPIAGNPADCIEAMEKYQDAGCTHIMLELWGENRNAQLELFGSKVLPHFRR